MKRAKVYHFLFHTRAKLVA